ncbi:MAG: FAD:protein FMN transferase, partial [Muribaculaceae bacterium]|nr:FAD:protein FMN transferase [Muribaculaceae bacterium]
TGMGMATSGNYRNFHEEGGRRYGHTISPKTGRPVQTDILSATVIAQTAMEADGLATALMAMGTAKAKETADTLELPVMLICRDTVWISPGFKSLTVEL